MAGEWPTVEIGAVADIYDGPHATPSFVDAGPVFLGIDALEEGRLDLSQTRHVTEDVFREWTRRVVPRSGDLVFSYETRIGQAALIPKGLKCCLGRRLALARPKSEALNNRYLLYYYLGPAFQEHLRAHTKPGSTVDRIHLRDFPKFPLVLPPRPYQDAVAELLGAIDDKIELNRRMAANLEEMARTLFKSWFGEFDRARSQTAQCLIDEGTIEIGDGYRAKNDELRAEGVPFIRAANLVESIDTMGAEKLDRSSALRAGSKMSRVGDVAFTSKGTIGRLARISQFTEECVYSPQVCYWRTLDENKIHRAILYFIITDRFFQAQINEVSRETDMAPYVSLQNQKRFRLPTLPSSQAERGVELEQFLLRREQLFEQNKILVNLRDTLLPKLISGDLRIKDAEKAVAA
ncbi:restriction endonuclease subunit S [Mesorhizobium sp.]|uniref:restriction endonuclease subunit S n=1 Tax=Mesorhizobium sp. TaxID=1871066 RepID=UPI001212296C|nr:restriction endonuclease subunit S [Mesorhizobium sp.]TIO04400.1 MAG: hypothetical protein E5X88_32020 [Mesorhizobium sp.]TIO36449.1 MAG: hypothetical protein E5X89_00035 [Mesorhizobium sp.]